MSERRYKLVPAIIDGTGFLQNLLALWYLIVGTRKLGRLVLHGNTINKQQTTTWAIVSLIFSVMIHLLREILKVSISFIGNFHPKE